VIPCEDGVDSFFFTLDFIARRYGATILRLEAGTLPVAFVFAHRSKFHAIGQTVHREL